MNKCDYDLLEFFSEMKINLKYFEYDDIGERINVLLPLDKNQRYKQLQILANKGIIHFRNKNTNKIVHDYNIYNSFFIKKDIYIELTDKGGMFITNEFNISWNEYCDFSIKIINEYSYKINIFTHPKKLFKVLNYLDIAIGKNYTVKEIKPWFPKYWKELYRGYEISFEILIDDYLIILDKYLNKTCNKYIFS